MRLFGVCEARCDVAGLSRHWGQLEGGLAWQAGTRTMNPTVPHEVIADAYAERCGECRGGVWRALTSKITRGRRAGRSGPVRTAAVERHGAT